MKTIILLALILSSFAISAKCPEIKDSELNSDQLIVKNLLQSAYKYKAEGTSSENLSDFTYQMKRDFVQASENLNEEEISSMIIEQDNDNNLCPVGTMVSSEVLTSLVSSVIYETYYGCGCEH